MEEAFLAWLRERLGPAPGLDVGPGDDAAVLRLGDERCVVTSDLLAEGTDFLGGECPWSWVGRKALAVNLSDLAAMAARPRAAVVSLLLPRRHGLEIAQAMYEGLLELAAEFAVPIAGGDTNTWEGPVVISITALGEVTPHGSWLRSGARPGDRILVTGRFGGSRLGRQFHFVPRVREALELNARYEVHAAIDVSDGLSLDLWRMACASRCGAMLELDRVPISEDATRLAARPDDDRSALDHALADGEDFELILAASPPEAEQMLQDQPLDVPLACIGEFLPREGLWSRTADGPPEELPPRGYWH